MTSSHSIIEIKDLTKSYKNSLAPAINKLNLEIDEGEIFGLLGPNGAGKTTTISILCGLLKPTEGEIFIKQYSVKNNINQIKKLIGIVPQDIALYNKLTARENLQYFGRMYDIPRKDLDTRIHTCLEMLGLGKRADDRLDKFSGGMKRRTNLIAGILHQPEILFLDEPTVGVDVQSRRVILDYLFELQKKGTTIIYTSHYLEEAENFCSQVAFIDNGEIIAKGTPEELTKSGENSFNLEKLFIKLTGRELRD